MVMGQKSLSDDDSKKSLSDKGAKKHWLVLDKKSFTRDMSKYKLLMCYKIIK